MTQIVALIGHPLQHSISPVFQQAAFDYCQLNVRYEKWGTKMSHLKTTVDRLRQSSILGANVTIPHKEAVVPLLDELDELAARIGAVNTVVNRGGRLVGYNTDAHGFMMALRQEGGFEPRGKDVFLMGAGGAARSVGFALAEAGVKRLTIANRTPERAEGLAGSIRSKTGPDIEISTLTWEELESGKALLSSDLLVNCTSMGMKHGPMESNTPMGAGSIPKAALVYDLIYNPIETPLLREAKKAGAGVLGGLAMLVYQGAASFEIWVARKAPVDMMFEQARKSLS